MFVVWQPFFVIESFPAIALVQLYVSYSVHSMNGLNGAADKSYLILLTNHYRIFVLDSKIYRSKIIQCFVGTNKLIWKTITLLSESFKIYNFLFVRFGIVYFILFYFSNSKRYKFWVSCSEYSHAWIFYFFCVRLVLFVLFLLQ